MYEGIRYNEVDGYIRLPGDRLFVSEGCSNLPQAPCPIHHHHSAGHSITLLKHESGKKTQQ